MTPVPTDFNHTLRSTLEGNSPTFGVGARPNLRIVSDAPPMNTYTLKTCFDGESPTMRKNHITTDFS